MTEQGIERPADEDEILEPTEYQPEEPPGELQDSAVNEDD